jgi:uncharacterized radical SAM superfamily protein
VHDAHTITSATIVRIDRMLHDDHDAALELHRVPRWSMDASSMQAVSIGCERPRSAWRATIEETSDAMH